MRDFGIHEGEPIGVVVTVRGEKTKELINKLLEARDRKLNESCFDRRGSVSFGIKEHIEIPGIRYDPTIGILGMNVSVLLERFGYRVARRNRRRSSIGSGHYVAKEDAMEYFRSNYRVTIA